MARFKSTPDDVLLDWGAKFDNASDDTAAWQGAIDQSLDSRGIGELKVHGFGVGTSLVDTLLIPDRISIKGPGSDRLKISTSTASPLIQGNGGTFTNEFNLKDISFVGELGSGHLIDTSTSGAARWELSNVDFWQQDPGSSIIYHDNDQGGPGWFFCDMYKVWFRQTDTSTEHAINIFGAASSTFNANSFRSCVFVQGSHDKQFARISTQGTINNSGVTFDVLTCQDTRGGALLLESCETYTVKNLGVYDLLGPVQQHMIHIKNGGSRRPARNRIVDYNRRGGSLDAGIKDMFFESSDSGVISNPSCRNTTTLVIDLTNKPIEVSGIDPTRVIIENDDNAIYGEGRTYSDVIPLATAEHRLQPDLFRNHEYGIVKKGGPADVIFEGSTADLDEGDILHISAVNNSFVRFFCRAAGDGFADAVTIPVAQMHQPANATGDYVFTGHASFQLIDGEFKEIRQPNPANVVTNTAASGTEAYNATTFVVTYGSTTQIAATESLTLVRYTLDMVDPGKANDGRQIVVEFDDHFDTTATVVSDTGGNPISRLLGSHITGAGQSWSFVADDSNDVRVSSDGTITTTIYVEDTSGANDSAVI